jgi:hypothetical protein
LLCLRRRERKKEREMGRTSVPVDVERILVLERLLRRDERSELDLFSHRGACAVLLVALGDRAEPDVHQMVVEFYDIVLLGR